MIDAATSFKAAEEIGAGCLCFQVRRAARAITRTYDAALRPLGIQAPQLTLLSAIAAAEPRAQRVPALVAGLAMDATTLSRNLRQLELDGLATVGRVPEDRRARVVTLTDRGRQVLAEALPLWRAAQAELAHRLGPELPARLRRDLSAVAHRMRGEA